MELKTKNGYIFYIDDEDYILAKNINWNKDVNGYVRGYCKVRKKTIAIHRLVMNVCDSNRPFIDHINGDKLHNEKENLRECTHSENMKNKSASGVSKYLGVSLHNAKWEYIAKSGKVSNGISTAFLSIITKNGKKLYLGRFKNEIDAAKAYNEAAIKYHGDFARLNTFD